jgi:glycosyltransferase involved in cell wall biosynthesis
VNYQNWVGVNDPKYGYGSMLKGFVDHVPDGVTLNKKASVEVYMGVPYVKGSWLEGVHRVCFTMWETDKLPGDFLRWLGQYDQILVTCQHNVELFSRHHDSVSYVPLGVDQTFWKPVKEPASGPFRFHAGGSLWGRKGLDVVIEAFRRLGIPDTELHIKIAPHAKDVPTAPPPKGVTFHRQWMTLEQQRDWFQQGHVYVAPARGEGFGLMPLQAIASGIPTILSDTSGQKQFAHLATGVIPVKSVRSPLGGNWDEPDVRVLTELMRDHYDRWQDHRQKALNTISRVGEFSWESAARKLVEAVPEGHLIKHNRTVEPDVMVRATFLRDVKADIGKHHYRFKKGETAMLTEGVHQVLYDAGAIE